MTTLGKITPKNNNVFFAIPDQYYSVGQAYTVENCSHEQYTTTTRSLGKQATLARVCDSCGTRVAFIKYAKYCK